MDLWWASLTRDSRALHSGGAVSISVIANNLLSDYGVTLGNGRGVELPFGIHNH